MGDVLRLPARLSAPPPVVYRALTDEAELRVWLAEHAEASPDERRFAFWGPSTPQGDNGRQRLLAAEADLRLSFTWTLDGVETRVDVEPEPDEDGGTVVHLQQDGMPTLEELIAPTGRRDGMHSMHTFWGLALANLAEHVEGRALTPRADFRPGRAPEIRVRIEIAASPRRCSPLSPTPRRPRAGSAGRSRSTRASAAR
ncbi:SRPBCC family protein [Salana multivorans]